MKKILLTSIVSILCSTSVFAQNSSMGYLTSTTGDVVKNGFGNCWNVSADNAPKEECGDKIEPPKVVPPPLKPKNIPVIPPKVIPITEIKQEKIVINASVLFKFDSSTLSESGKKTLLDKVVFVKPANVEVHGHTDLIGTEKYNMKLSLQRAEAVKEYLVQNGIPPQNISTKALGESQPICKDKHTTKNSECSVKNRRIEINAVYMK